MIYVFHLSSEAFRFRVRDIEFARQLIQDPTQVHYRLVALVETDDLEQAFHLTNHIDDDWTKNKGVKAVVSECRSTSVGDILVHGNEFWFCAPVGWTKMDL